MNADLEYRDRRWRARRRHRLHVAGYRCERCGNRAYPGVPLVVHHKFYKDGAPIWAYHDDELEVLCKRCHGAHHQELPTIGIWRWTRPRHAAHRLRRHHEPMQLELFARSENVQST